MPGSCCQSCIKILIIYIEWRLAPFSPAQNIVTFKQLFEYTCTKDMAPQIMLISGCSSGIGLAIAVLFAKDAEKRFKVYATMRNLAKKGKLEQEVKDQLGDTLIIKQLDVCSDESVKNTVQEILDAEEKIDVLCK